MFSDRMAERSKWCKKWLNQKPDFKYYWAERNLYGWKKNIFPTVYQGKLYVYNASMKII